MTAERAFRLVMVVAFAAAAFEPALAQTASPIQTVLQSVIDMLSGTTATVAATLAIMIVGYMFLAGQVDMMRLFQVVGGIILIVGAATLAKSWVGA